MLLTMILLGRFQTTSDHCQSWSIYNLVHNLTGTIPPWIGNFSSLYLLSVSLNNLHGSIPSELRLLSRLRLLQLYANNLSGTIPPQIYNISSLNYFGVTQNQLHGSIPLHVGLTLPNLEIYAGGVNSFTRTIPLSLSNASQLWLLDFAQNGLFGTVPQNLASFQGLVRLNFDDNRLGNGKDGNLNFLNYLDNCTSLEILGLARSNFGGLLPNSIANLSTQLKRLTMGTNMIHGGIPIGIGNLLNLNLLGLEGNYLEDPLPDVSRKLQNLPGIELDGNRISGPR